MNLNKQASARTNVGKARAFVYYCLSEGVLGECLQTALNNAKVGSERSPRVAHLAGSRPVRDTGRLLPVSPGADGHVR